MRLTARLRYVLLNRIGTFRTMVDVAVLHSPSPMGYDLTDLFAERHAYFACTLTALAQADPGRSRDACLGDFTSVMAAHLKSVERGTERLQRFGPSDTLNGVIRTYGSAGLALAALLVPGNADEQFVSQLNSLVAAVQAMCRTEQRVVIPALEALLNNNECVDLVIEMQHVFEEHVGRLGVDGFPLTDVRIGEMQQRPPASSCNRPHVGKPA